MNRCSAPIIVASEAAGIVRASPWNMPGISCSSLLLGVIVSLTAEPEASEAPPATSATYGPRQADAPPRSAGAHASAPASACEGASAPKTASGSSGNRLREGPFHLDLRVQTDFPLAVGGRLNAELPGRIQLSTALGVLPSAYVGVINNAVISAGGYDRFTAYVIRDALRKSLVWRTHLGWRPFEKRGWYFEAGYGFVSLGLALTPHDVLVAALGNDAPGVPDDIDRAFTYDIRTHLHMIDAETGWRWLLAGDRIVLSAALGFAATVDARTRIEPRYPNSVTDSGPARTVADIGERHLDEIYERYVFIPVGTVSAGYRFF